MSDTWKAAMSEWWKHNPQEYRREYQGVWYRAPEEQPPTRSALSPEAKADKKRVVRTVFHVKQEKADE